MGAIQWRLRQGGHGHFDHLGTANGGQREAARQGLASGAAMRLALVALLAITMLTTALLPAAQARQPQAAIVVDARSGKVLFARHADSPRYPASISKVMTLYLLFREIRAGRLSLNSRLRVSRRAALIPPSKLWLKPGQTITVDQAIRALAVKSANDVATVVAENIAGSEAAFARRMTLMARALGMTRTTFRNASGLPNPPNVSTARDLATLSLRLMRDFPHFYKRYFALKTFRWRGRALRNHNRLLWRVAGMDGIKTGYTRAAGSNLAASVRRNGRRIVAVVLGMPSSRARNRYMASLIEKSFRQYRLQTGTRIAALAGTPPGWNPARARVLLARLRQMSAPATRKVAAARKTTAARAVAAARPRPRLRQAVAVAAPAPVQARKLASLALQAATLPLSGASGPDNTAGNARVARKNAPAPRDARDATPRMAPPTPQPRPGQRQQPQPRAEMAVARQQQRNTPSPADAVQPGLNAPATRVRVRVRVAAADAGARRQQQARPAGTPIAITQAGASRQPGTAPANAIRIDTTASAKSAALLHAGNDTPVASAGTAVVRAEIIEQNEDSAVMVLARRAPAAAVRSATRDASVEKARESARPAAGHPAIASADTHQGGSTPPAATPVKRSSATNAQAALAALPAEEILLPEPSRARQLMQARWLIQIGAFPTLDGAKKYLEKARRLSRNVRGEQPVVIRVRKGAKMFYRARYAGMSRRQAIRACRELKRRGLACLPMAPGAG